MRVERFFSSVRTCARGFVIGSCLLYQEVVDYNDCILCADYSTEKIKKMSQQLNAKNKRKLFDKQRNEYIFFQISICFVHNKYKLRWTSTIIKH